MAVVIGLATGGALGATVNIQRRAEFGEYRPALSSLLLDRRGRVITEFFAEERREIVSIHDLPKHLLQAVITKEDRTFFSHAGFSPKGIARAAWNILAGHYFSGGSTISQQVAGNLYEDRSITTLGRKLAELWWSFQLEKKRSKYEILEIYLNNSKFGHGNYGVESASQFYFGHAASDLTLAESTLLVVHLSNPVTRSMINYPNRARGLQRTLLDDMVSFGYVEAEEADAAFDGFWSEYEPTLPEGTTTHTIRTDLAPAFSELIRLRFEELFYGSPDLYRDGFVIHSGLDLDYQEEATRLLEETAAELSSGLESDRESRDVLIDGRMVPAVELLGTMFGIKSLRLADPWDRESETVRELVVPPVAALGLLLGTPDIDPGSVAGRDGDTGVTIAGTLAAIDTDTGHIVTYASHTTGDSREPGRTGLDPGTGHNLGTTAGVLVYAAAIEAGAVTSGSMLYDSPMTFVIGGEPIDVISDTGRYRGPVPAWQGVADSLVTPLFKIAEAVPENEVTRLLSRGLSRFSSGESLTPSGVYRAIDGVVATPLDLARAVSAFPQAGNPTEPIAIRFIEDRHGVVVYNSELDARRRGEREEALVSPGTAYVVADTMSRSLSDGRLSRRVAEVGGIARSDLGAVSGTTVDRSDAWVAGFSSEITTVVWFASLGPEASLGPLQSGASVAGPVWTRFMKTIHADLPGPAPVLPPTGVITRQVCAVSGDLPTGLCTDGVVELPFLSGTEPDELCHYHATRSEQTESFLDRLADRFELESIPGSLLSRSPAPRLEDGTGADDGEIDHDDRNPFLD